MKKKTKAWAVIDKNNKLVFGYKYYICPSRKSAMAYCQSYEKVAPIEIHYSIPSKGKKK